MLHFCSQTWTCTVCTQNVSTIKVIAHLSMHCTLLKLSTHHKCRVYMIQRHNVITHNYLFSKL